MSEKPDKFTVIASAFERRDNTRQAHLSIDELAITLRRTARAEVRDALHRVNEAAHHWENLDKEQLGSRQLVDVYVDMVLKLTNEYGELTHTINTIKTKPLHPAFEEGAFAEVVPCGMYNCTNLRAKQAIMCKSCQEDYKQDPDAYK